MFPPTIKKMHFTKCRTWPPFLRFFLIILSYICFTLKKLFACEPNFYNLFCKLKLFYSIFKHFWAGNIRSLIFRIDLVILKLFLFHIQKDLYILWRMSCSQALVGLFRESIMTVTLSYLWLLHWRQWEGASVHFLQSLCCHLVYCLFLFYFCEIWIKFNTLIANRSL